MLLFLRVLATHICVLLIHVKVDTIEVAIVHVVHHVYDVVSDNRALLGANEECAALGNVVHAAEVFFLGKHFKYLLLLIYPGYDSLIIGATENETTRL